MAQIQDNHRFEEGPFPAPLELKDRCIDLTHVLQHHLSLPSTFYLTESPLKDEPDYQELEPELFVDLSDSLESPLSDSFPDSYFPPSMSMSTFAIGNEFTYSSRQQSANKETASSEESPPSRPGPIPATSTRTQYNQETGTEELVFFYSKRKQVKKYTIKCPAASFMEKELPYEEDFLNKNCIYPRAMGDESSYKGNRRNYEMQCNRIGWRLASLNPELREQRGLIQRAVDSWRNTREDVRLRSRRAKKQFKTKRL